MQVATFAFADSIVQKSDVSMFACLLLTYSKTHFLCTIPIPTAVAAEKEMRKRQTITSDAVLLLS